MRFPNNYITITQIFKSNHLGADLGWNGKYGGPYHDIIAIADGTVISTTEGYNCTWPNYKSYGNYIHIDHGNGITAIYAHLKKGSVAVKRGQRVAEGQVIGKMGNSGYCINCDVHLHFEIRKNGKKVDPIPYLLAMPNQYISEKTLIPERIKRGEILKIEPVNVDKSKNQIKVNIDILNARSNPYLGDNILGILKKGYYNVLETRDMTHEASNRYFWYKIADNIWCAKVDGVTFYQAEKPPVVATQPKPNTRVAEMEKKLSEIQTDLRTILELAKKHV